MPADLVSELRSVLAHWHNTPYLENHPLAERMACPTEGTNLSRAQALRRALRLAIEVLQPATALPPGAPEARPYEVLCRHYIARQTMTQIALDLDICEREAYRELRTAMDALVQIVQGYLGRPEQVVGAPAEDASKIREEVERLAAASAEDVDLMQLLAEVSASAQCLARDRGIHIQVLAEQEGPRVAANRVMLRQALLNLLSYMVRDHNGDELHVELHHTATGASVRFTHRPQTAIGSWGTDEPYAVAAQLLSSLGMQWSRRVLADGRVLFSISISRARERGVLIVDDNEGLTALLTRYLQHSAYNVYCAHTFGAALELLQRAQPEIILLDVMMPGRDGWELMEEMRATVPGGEARIIVCSIINDPELALALGADGFLHKPVSRSDLLAALDRAA